MRKLEETSGVVEALCPHCGQERRCSFNIETIVFNKRVFKETTYNCHWCGTKSVVEERNFQKTYNMKVKEVEFDFG
jgi:C4-type Zn-finger protein